MFLNIISDIYTIFFILTLFSLLLWIVIPIIRFTFGILFSISEYRPLLFIDNILGFYKVIPSTFFLLGVCVAVFGHFLNSSIGDHLDSLFEKIVNAQDTAVKATANSDGTSPHPDQLPETFTNSLGMEFVLIPAGSYIAWEEGKRSAVRIVEKNEFGETVMEYSPRMVVSTPFYLGRHPVTQEQWAAVMGKNPATRNLGRSNPVNSVSWLDAQKFIRSLNQRDGMHYRLPTEAEWEYASRRDSDADSHNGRWQGLKNGGDPYISEWVQDRYGALPTERETINYRGAEKGSERVQRHGPRRQGKNPGGGILDHSSEYSDVGFRLAFFPSCDHTGRRENQTRPSAPSPAQSQAAEEVTFIGTVETPGRSHGSLIGAADALVFEMVPEIGGKIFEVCRIGDTCKVTAVIDPNVGMIARLISVECVARKRSP